MKAFVLYKKEECQLRQLFQKMQNYGSMCCDFLQFIEIYNKWHLQTFRGAPIDYGSATFRDDWFHSFLNFIINYDI